MIDLHRRDDWPERLQFAITEHQKGDFEWGQYDCATLFSDAVWAMTNVDPLEEGGRWRSEFDALRALVRVGHTSIKSFLDAKFETVHPSEARRGDVGYPANPQALSCPAVIVGAEAMSRDQSGWIVFPVSELKTVYRIG